MRTGEKQTKRENVRWGERDGEIIKKGERYRRGERRRDGERDEMGRLREDKHRRRER